MKKKPFQDGFVSFYMIFIVLVLVFSISLSMSMLALNYKKNSKIDTESTKAYLAAESGIEDALLKLSINPLLGNTTGYAYTFNFDDYFVSVTISQTVGGSRSIESEGIFGGKTRKIRVIYEIDKSYVSFHYGVQVGAGGMVMNNNSRVIGNVFSNGSVVGDGYIENSIVVATNGNRIEDINVGEDAKAHSCIDSTINGVLTYVAGGSAVNCTAGSYVDIQPNEILPQDFPIPQETIDDWEASAEAGGVTIGNISLANGATMNLGPRKITGNLTLGNNSVLTMFGTLWINGNLTINNGAKIRLDPNSYGSLSGVVIVDGATVVRPGGAALEGSGQPGSFLLLLSTNSSLLQSAPAIAIDNTSSGGIFYAGNGLILVENNVMAREVTGYKIILEENAEVRYETGLANAQFSSGPSGGWKVANWQEIQ